MMDSLTGTTQSNYDQIAQSIIKTNHAAQPETCCVGATIAQAHRKAAHVLWRALQRNCNQWRHEAEDRCAHCSAILGAANLQPLSGSEQVAMHHTSRTNTIVEFSLIFLMNARAMCVRFDD